MKKIVTGLLTVAFVFGINNFAVAETHVTEDLQVQIQRLMLQVKELQAKLEFAQQKNVQLERILKMNRTLDLGDEGDDVKTLQEVLASDPEIYPEGKVTGFFGPLTEKAIKKFQEKFGISQAGRVGPMTLERLNYILENGAGKSGVVPPGLLKKFTEGETLKHSNVEAKIKCELKNKAEKILNLESTDCELKLKVKKEERDEDEEEEN